MSVLPVSESSLRDALADRRNRLTTAIDSAPGTQVYRSLLEQVDSALRHLDEGSYGLCRVCHDPIEIDRLAVDPLVTNCLDCLTPAQRRDLELDLDRAARTQAALLPPRDLTVAGWEVHYHYEPAGPVSGDFCDLIPAGDGFGFILGDVSGKGVAASILMSHLQAVFRGLLGEHAMLQETVAAANRLLCQSTLPSHYATAVVGRARGSGEVEIINAGHCAPLVVAAGKPTTLPSHGLPLGMFCSGDYERQTIRLAAGDALVLYTDGLPETTAGGREEYGVARIASLLADRNGTSAAEMARACLEATTAFKAGSPRADDTTVMVLRRTGASA